MIVLEIIITIIAATNLLLSWFVVFALTQPTSVLKWLVKVLVCGLSPVLLLVSLVTLCAAALLNFVPVILVSSFSGALYLSYILKVSRSSPANGLDCVFGKQWEDRITSERKSTMLNRRYVFLLPKCDEPLIFRNISFYTIRETNRQLLCDVWQPPAGVVRSGLAVIYLHGSAWTHLDKDYGTRPFFRHLVNQGHVIMDVAYRLFPETGFMGMLHDTKHAIAWLKSNASIYSINPDKIVVAGGSAGAHLALLAAYTDKEIKLIPSDLANSDLTVRGVVAFYGQSELSATYYHTCQHLIADSAVALKKKDNKPREISGWMRKWMGDDFHRLGFNKDVEPGMLAPILGGSPDEMPEAYALFSPISYVHKNCPDTLLIHGEHDILAPLDAIRRLHKRLADSGVPVVLQTIPKTDHAFDLILPKISPSAHNAIYEVERFLALMEYEDLRTTDNRYSNHKTTKTFDEINALP